MVSKAKKNAKILLDMVCQELIKRGYRAKPNKKSLFWFKWGIDTNAPNSIKNNILEDIKWNLKDKISRGIPIEKNNLKYPVRNLK